jgi:cytochrome c biogenesis protein CcdA
MLISATAGLFAGISPCTLPIYPVILNQITRQRENPKLAALLFTSGLMGTYFILYLLVGLLASVLGFGIVEEFETLKTYLLLAAALFSWLLAWLTLKGGVNFGTRQLVKANTGGGYLGALASGFVYGTAISPCNAAFLFTGILPALASETKMLEGFILLLLFSTAMALPMLLIGLVSGKAFEVFALVNKNRKKIERISAIFLIAVGFYYLIMFAILRYF